jgi:acyl-CoA synthetase (AMP-forming)/AMP-acid ligase II
MAFPFMYRTTAAASRGACYTDPRPLSRCVTDARLTNTKESTRRVRLADLKVPDEIMFLEKLPKGISGKIQRTALKEFEIVAA